MKSVEKYLKEPKNTVVRETILKYGFFHLIKLAACSFNRHLKIYEQEVDNEGCDVIIEDSFDLSRKIQLKSLISSNTNAWEIHRNILLPSYSQMEEYGFDTLLGPTRSGAVIIIEPVFDGNEIINYNFYYTDIKIISLISIDSDLIPKKSPKNKLDANSILRQVSDLKRSKIRVNKGMFIKTDALGLIKIMGFCNQYQFSNSSQAFIRNNKNTGLFFRKIPGYSALETCEEVFKSWNERLKEDNDGHRRVITDSLHDIIRS